MTVLIRRFKTNNAGQVTAMQAELKRLNYDVGAIDGNYGPKSEAAVKLFQNRKSLLGDGVVGPITWSRLFPDETAFEALQRSTADENINRARPVELLISVASKYIGIHERGGANRGPEIDAWLRDLGVPLGSPWCMAFVQGCFKETAQRLGVKDPLKPDTAGCLDLWNRVPDQWRFGHQQGRRGDIVIWDHGKGAGHTGIVKGYGAGVYSVIEGNTNDDGVREGYEVCIRDDRKYNDPKLKGFIRVPWT